MGKGRGVREGERVREKRLVGEEGKGIKKRRGRRGSKWEVTDARLKMEG